MEWEHAIWVELSGKASVWSYYLRQDWNKVKLREYTGEECSKQSEKP